MTLKAFILNSGLSQDDKDIWFSVLEKLDDVQIKSFEDFIGPVRGRARAGTPEGPTGQATSNGVNSNEENLRLLTENLKTKTQAIKNLDEKAMEKIIEQESTIYV